MWLGNRHLKSAPVQSACEWQLHQSASGCPDGTYKVNILLSIYSESVVYLFLNTLENYLEIKAQQTLFDNNKPCFLYCMHQDWGVWSGKIFNACISLSHVQHMHIQCILRLATLHTASQLHILPITCFSEVSVLKLCTPSCSVIKIILFS